MKCKTVCDLINETINLTDNKQIIENLLEIKRMAGRMEERLLQYCNAIEDLGFVRVGRDYSKQ